MSLGFQFWLKRSQCFLDVMPNKVTDVAMTSILVTEVEMFFDVVLDVEQGN